MAETEFESKPELGFMPVKYERGEPLFDNRQVKATAARLINQSNYFKRVIKPVTEDFKAAQETCDSAQLMFERSLDKMFASEKKLSEGTKRVTGQIRKASNELAAGLKKVEQQADFSQLERYVVLLERASVALDSLAELEKSGRLERIAAAITINGLSDA